MDSTVTIDDVPNRLSNCVDSEQSHSTRETDSGNTDLCTMPRPPPTGEDSSETIRSKEAITGPTKAECPSPRLTPRRYTAKELPASCGLSHTSDEDKLAPLGFEPEGEAVSTPTFREASCFTDMLMDSEGCFVFYQYLRRVNGHILMDFCRACDEFRGIVNTAPQKLSSAKVVFQQYIVNRGACEQLGIKANTRAKIAELISVQPIDPLLFEEAYTQVVSNMKNLHYKSFLNSSFFKECDDMPADSKVSNDSYNRRFQSGYLPTLPEEKVLGFGDEIEEFEFEQQSKNTKPLYGGANSSTSDEKNARKLLHVPIKDVSSPYYYPTAPLASITESGSISSDALTDDTMSMTTDTSDGTRYSGGRRTHRSSRTAQQRYPFVPRTHRMPKEARHPMNPDDFARILTEKLEKVQLERQLQEREAVNLSQSLDVERPGSAQSKKSILQEAIENKERRDRIPLSTMVQLPVQDDSSSISTSNHSSSKSTSARATAGSGAQNSSSSESTHRKYRNTRHGHSKSSKHEAESVNKINEELPPNMYKEPKEIKNTNLANEDIPFLTLNHHRIQEWMAAAEEELKKQKTKSHQSKSRQSSSSRADSYAGHNQPLQPIAQDPMMPLLQGPEATTVLGEVRRRLMETKEQDRKNKQRHRSRNSVEDTSDHSSYCKESSTDLSSSCSQSLLSYDLNQHQSYSSIPSSASNMGNDTKSRSDSGIGGGIRKKEKHNATTLIYWLWGEPIAYRTCLPGKHITLGQFKTQLTPRRGEFRYFFKTKTDDRDCEVVYEEVRDDDVELPKFEGKIIGKVEKVD